jgi:rhodanese-related sulfurtransferase
MTIDELLERARRRLVRVDAAQAAGELEQGALMVDIRPLEQRTESGEIPGAVVINRNVLEWRLDPASPWRIPQVADPSARIIVVCAEGFSSSLAAATLQELGLVNATDLIGGFNSWREAGLPVRPYASS